MLQEQSGVSCDVEGEEAARDPRSGVTARRIKILKKEKLNMKKIHVQNSQDRLSYIQHQQMDENSIYRPQYIFIKKKGTRQCIAVTEE